MILSNYIYRTNNIFYQFNIVPYDLQIKINTHSEYSLWSYNSSIELKEDISITFYNQK